MNVNNNILVRQCSTLLHVWQNILFKSVKLEAWTMERQRKREMGRGQVLHGDKQKHLITSTSGLFPKGENVSSFRASLALRWRCRGEVR